MKQAQIVLYSDIVVGGGLEIKMKNFLCLRDSFLLCLSLCISRLRTTKFFGFLVLALRQRNWIMWQLAHY